MPKPGAFLQDAPRVILTGQMRRAINLVSRAASVKMNAVILSDYETLAAIER